MYQKEINTAFNPIQLNQEITDAHGWAEVPPASSRQPEFDESGNLVSSGVLIIETDNTVDETIVDDTIASHVIEDISLVGDFRSQIQSILNNYTDDTNPITTETAVEELLTALSSSKWKVRVDPP